VPKTYLIAEVSCVGTRIASPWTGISPSERWYAGWVAMRPRGVWIKSTPTDWANNESRIVRIWTFVTGKEFTSTNPYIQIRGEGNLRLARVERCLSHKEPSRKGITTAFSPASLVQFTTGAL